MTISISRDGLEIGEWPENEIREFYHEGRLVDTDLFWKEGMTEWAPLSQLIRPPPPFPRAQQTSRSLATPEIAASATTPNTPLQPEFQLSSRFPNETTSIKLHNHNHKCLTLTPSNGRLLFLCGGSLCAWDLKSPTYEILVETLEDPSGYTEFFKLQILPDESRVVLIGRNGHLFSLDEKKRGISRLGDLILAPEDQISCFKISPDGRYAIVGAFKRYTMHGHKDVSLRLWDLKTLKPVIEFVGHKNPIQHVHFSRDGSELITCSGFVGDHGFYECEAPRYLIWTVDDGSCVSSYGGLKKISRYDEGESEPGDELSSGCLDTSPDWRFGLFSHKQTIKVVKLSTWETVRSFDGLSAGIRQARFSEDGNFVFALTENQEFHCWHWPEGKTAKRINGFSAYADDFVVTSNNDSMITTHSDGGYGAWLYRRTLFPQ